MSRLWVTGYRSYELGVFGDTDPKLAVLKYALRQALVQAIENGVDWIITGPQMGVEQWAAEVALELKKDYPEIQVALMTPFAEFGKQWNEANRGKLQVLYGQVDFHDSVSEKPYESPRQLQAYQSFMLTHTDNALLLYDVDHEGKTMFDYNLIMNWQEQHPYPLTLISMDDLQEAAIDYGESQESDKFE